MSITFQENRPTTLEPSWNMFDLTPEGRIPDWDEQLCYHCDHG